MDKERITEDGYRQEGHSKSIFDLMTDDEKKISSFYMGEYDELSADMDARADEWADIENLYTGDREESADPTSNSYVNVIMPNVEGQMATLVNSVITASVRGVGYSDQRFAHTCDLISRAILKHNKIKRVVKRVGRRYVLFGNAKLEVRWDVEALDEFGMPVIEPVSNSDLLIAKNVQGVEDIKNADFVIKVIRGKSLLWARERWGDEKADAITLGVSGNAFDENTEDEQNYDHEKTFTYLEVWTKNNPGRNLQRIEMATNGLVLSMSDPGSSFYKYAKDFPFFVTSLYPKESDMYGFGDGKALKPIQELINKIYDELLLAIKFSSQGRTYSDPHSQLDPDEFAECDPRKPLMVRNPSVAIKTERGAGINEVVFQVLEQLFGKVQEITRFSSLMTGNDPGVNMTATQAGIQMQQGIAGIDDKRSDISELTGEALVYALKLCMEFWPAAKALRVSDNQDDFEWVDARQLAKIPVMVPATEEYTRRWRKRNPKKDASEVPRFMQLQVKGEDGEEIPATKMIELDVDVSIGEGLPTNKAALYNIILSLAQIQVPDETGVPRALMSYKQARRMAEETIGLKIEDHEVPPVAANGGSQPVAKGMDNSMHIPGANVSGKQTKKVV